MIAPEPSLRPGAELDRYTVQRLLGVGGMSEVWEVRHRVLGSRLALKVLRAADPRLQGRLIAEGRASAALDHENLLPVRDTVAIGETLGLILPLVEGPALDVLLRAYRPTVAEALALFRGVVRGVAAVHAQGWVHRDLKPGNVLLDLRQGRVVPRVADFGLVLSEQGERAQGFLGTLAYAAPEQLRDASTVDRRADLWALGVVLVELLSGARPYAGGTLAELAQAHRAAPRLGAPGPGPEAIARALLRVEVADRMSSCEALLEALDTLDPGSNEPLQDPGPLYRAAWELRRAAPEEGRQATVSLVAEASIAPAERPPDNLPPRRDGFLGRREELASLKRLVRQGAQLVTLLGAGGSGKTRLAIEFARQGLLDWPGGAWFCDLTEARDEAAVLGEVASSLGVRLQPGDSVAQLGRALAARGRALVLLDNAEQVVEEVASVLARWLEQGVSTIFLVTSRAALGLRREQITEVGPLALPDRRASRTEDVLVASAGALLVARAQEAVPGWKLKEQEVTAASELLELLDGLPLAIELAAARLRVMSLGALRERIRDRFRLLAAPGSRTDRQSTLRAVMDWSWNLLGEPEQIALAQLSVFEGGFGLEAAEAVVALPASAPWAVDVVQLLLDRSLLRLTSANDEEPRFGMYVSIREYAAERRDAMGRGREEERHGAFYARFGERGALDALVGPGGVALEDALLLDLDNLLAACRRAVQRRDAGVAARTLCAAGTLARRVGGARLGGEELARGVLGLLDDPSLDSGLRANACLCAARISYGLGRVADAVAQVERGAAIAREGGEADLEAQLTTLQGSLLGELGRAEEARDLLERGHQLAMRRGGLRTRAHTTRLLAERQLYDLGGEAARAHAETALDLFRRVGDRQGELSTRITLAAILARAGQPEELWRLLNSTLDLARALRDRDNEGRILLHLATFCCASGRTEEGTAFATEALRLAREQGNRFLEALALLDLADLLGAQGRHRDAIDVNHSALGLLSEQGRVAILLVPWCNLSFAWLALGRYEEAEAVLRDGLDLARELGSRWYGAVLLRSRAVLRGRQGRLHEARADFDQADAVFEAARDDDQLSQSLLARAELEAEAGDQAAAIAALARAEAMVAAMGSSAASVVGKALASARRAVRGS